MPNLWQPLDQDRLHNLLTANMFFGVAACGPAIYFMVTGEYTNLPARQTAEACLTRWPWAAWYLDQFLRPMMRNTQSHSH